MMYPLCKSIFLGGVTRRFPGLPFAFLECGVGWACTMLNDLVEHWERRNLAALQTTRPDLLDTRRLEELLRSYPGRLFDRFDGDLTALVRDLARPDPVPDVVDEWVHLGISSAAEIRDLFVPDFYFGCEADDRTTAFAFSPANAFRARLNAMFSSDIGHWDAGAMNRVVAAAWGLVEQAALSEQDFRDFVFTNPARLYLSANPDFFGGTAVDGAVASLAAERAPLSRPARHGGRSGGQSTEIRAISSAFWASKSSKLTRPSANPWWSCSTSWRRAAADSSPSSGTVCNGAGASAATARRRSRFSAAFAFLARSRSSFKNVVPREAIEASSGQGCRGGLHAALTIAAGRVYLHRTPEGRPCLRVPGDRARRSRRRSGTVPTTRQWA